jgi:hypothetical protein
MAGQAYIFSALRNAERETKRILEAIPDTLESEPLEPGGWSAHQILFHLRDTNAQVYLPRLRKMLAEDNPLFQDFDPDGWMETHYDPKIPREKLLENIRQQCQETADWLEELSHLDWERPGTHAVLGTHPLEWWADRMVAHLGEHLAQLRGD